MILTLLLAFPAFSETSVQISKTDEPETTVRKKSKTDILKPYTAELTGHMKGMPMKASGSRSLQKHTDGSWELNFDAGIGAFMDIAEHSSFNLSQGHIKPEAYSYKRSGLIGSKKEENARFDWKKAQVNWQKNKKKWAIKLQQGALDNLSYQTQLRLDLAAGKKDLSYLIVDEDEVYERSFTNEGEEFVQTSAGKLKAVKVKINRDNDKRETYIWFAKDWDYFFIKLLQKEAGTEYTVEIKSASIDGQPIKGI
ncbi:MAG: DUF3108 domain-containing protein [Endozoicomonas sp. (ex Botrylloides leachii)]|nr:DUF3108 domain-containing protein [Endozoicomonas sp. (ex Botrylloides leachii)]